MNSARVSASSSTMPMSTFSSAARQPLRGGMLGALMRKRVHQLLPHEAGDRGCATRGDGEHGEADQVGGLVAGGCAVIKEEQGRSDDRHGRADKARTKAAQ